MEVRLHLWQNNTIEQFRGGEILVLIAMEDAFVLQVITGKKDISEFDRFISDWKAQGGDEILKDMQDIADGRE